MEETFAELLGRFRETAGLTQRQLADRARVSIRVIQGWEQGRRLPTVGEAFFRLCRALGIPADAFGAMVDHRGPRPRTGKKD